MHANLGASPLAGNGDAPGAFATGMSVEDAAYHTAHGFPGRVAALALRMGMSANTLQHKVNPNNATHQLLLREAVAMMAITGNVHMLHAMADELGCVVLCRAEVEAPAPQLEANPMLRISHMVEEFSDVLTQANAALADGRVTLNEMRRVEREAAQLMAAIQRVLGSLRSMMPCPPGGVEGAA